MITTEQIKELRDKTGVSVMQCKKALEEAGGDAEKALIILKKKSNDIAAKKSDRNLSGGVVQSYIHGTGNVGVLIELLCETDFVAKNQEFKDLAYDIAMHIAAMNPEFVKKDDITPENKSKVLELFTKEVEESGKPIEMREKIIQGKMDAYFAEQTLLQQSFVKKPDITVEDLINTAVQKFGEKIEVRRFVRYGLLN